MNDGMHVRIRGATHARSYDARPNRGASRSVLRGPNPTGLIDKFAVIPILACFFAVIVGPLLSYLNPPSTEAVLIGSDGSLAPRFFWPALSFIAIILALQNRSRLNLPPHLICLFAYLVLAGTSVLWALSPEHSFIRFLQQVMVVTSIVLPAMLAGRTVDMMRALFLCFALALILNLFVVLTGSSQIARYGSLLVRIGYPGYFLTKNQLGECAAAAFLLSLHETFQPGYRRALGIAAVVIAVFLVFKSDSKTAFGLALACPILAWLTLLVRRVTHLSPAVILLSLPLLYVLVSSVSHSSVMERISYILYHDSSLTGRTTIWDFVKTEIAKSPLIGWGYQSFWLVPDSPSLTAPGWVKSMPNAHNGYYDTMLETGYAGFAFLLLFIMATLHAVGRVADRDPARARLLLSFVLFMILYNFFESLWMRGFEALWVVFVIVAAEIGRYRLPFPPRQAAVGLKSQRLGGHHPSPDAPGA